MAYTLMATVPTVYQYSSLKSLTGVLPSEQPDGSFSTAIDFHTREEAIAFMLTRASCLIADDKELDEVCDEILTYGTMRYDCATMVLGD